MKKVIKITTFILVEFILIIGCLFMGMYVNNKAEEKQPLKINKIALVNLDDGIIIDGINRYYGAEFIRTLEDNFEITGLEQARRGMENNLYAGYIVIPAAFSKNIESINREPVKSNILFKINANLDESVREKVIADITNFNSQVSTNIEYVYLDAILKEVHSVQDGAAKLLENDLKDLKQILKFTENEMIVDPDYPKQERPNNTIKQLNLNKIFSEMQTVFSDLSSEYKKNQKEAQKGYQELIDPSAGITAQIDSLGSDIDKIGDISSGQEFTLEDKEEIVKLIEQYNNDLLDWKNDYSEQVLDNMDTYMEACEKYAAKQAEVIFSDQKNQLVSYYEEAFSEIDNYETAFDYNDKASENYLSLESLQVYKYAIEEIDYLKKRIKELEAELSGSGLSGTNLGDLESPEKGLKKALENDMLEITRRVEESKNKAFKMGIAKWFCKELCYYGASEDDINKINIESIDLHQVKMYINNYCAPWFEIEVEPDEPEEEDQIEPEDGIEGESQTDEDDKSEEEIKAEQQKKRRKESLFLYTTEPEQFDIEDLNSVIKSTVLRPVSTVITEKNRQLTEDYKRLSTDWLKLNRNLSSFSIEGYGNEEAKNTIEQRFEKNIQEVQTAVNEKGDEYLDFVSKANETNDKNLEEWEKSINLANKKTRSNVNNNLKGIKENREKINADNNDLMEGIVSILPYTRIGELQNKKVYSYITTPIEYKDLSDSAEKQVEKEEKKVTWHNPIVIIIGLLICLIGSVFLLKKILYRNNIPHQQDLL